LIVLSAATASGEAVAEHRHDAALSTRGQHRVIAGAGHWLPLDAPDAVAAAIQEIVEILRDQG
jgi:pimeloyl-ACP methyl ester carboxylesterase